MAGPFANGINVDDIDRAIEDLVRRSSERDPAAMIPPDERSLTDRLGLGGRRLIGGMGEVANQWGRQAYDGAGIALEGLDSASRSPAVQTTLGGASLIPGVQGAAIPLLAASLINSGLRDPYRASFSKASGGDPGFQNSADSEENIIRGPGPDGVYRVGGNQRYENSRGSFSRSNQSIGERLQDEAKFDKEFGDTFQGLIGQLVHAGVIPDENQISGKPDAEGVRHGGLRSLANEMAASSIPRNSRAAYSPTGGQIPEEPDNSGDDSTSNTQLALMGTLIAGLVDQMAFKGAGRKMLGNQLGKIPGLGKLASKGEAKAVEAAAKANGLLKGRNSALTKKPGDVAFDKITTEKDMAANIDLLKRKIGGETKGVTTTADKGFPENTRSFTDPRVTAQKGQFKQTMKDRASRKAEAEAADAGMKQRAEDITRERSGRLLPPPERDVIRTADKGRSIDKTTEIKDRFKRIRAQRAEDADFSAKAKQFQKERENLPAKRETTLPAVRKGGPGTSKPGSASESPSAAKLRASRRPRLEYTPQQEKQRKSLMSQIKEATGSAKLKLKAKLKKLRDDSLPEDGF